MENKINLALNQIEQKNHVRIVFACEAGSRAWGVFSEKSDYDIRFVYVYPQDSYLSIDESKDVINVPVDHPLDLHGWDLKKTLKLLRHSNPTLLEWLKSDIVYNQNDGYLEVLRELAAVCFSPKSCVHHYLSMAKHNFRRQIESEQTDVKSYFYILRPILACRWIQQFREIPPLRFQTLHEGLDISANIKQEMKVLQQLKENNLISNQINGHLNTAILNDYIEKEMADLHEYVRLIPAHTMEVTEKLNDLFRKAIKEIWQD